MNGKTLGEYLAQAQRSKSARRENRAYKQAEKAARQSEPKRWQHKA